MKDGTVFIGDGHYEILTEHVFPDGYKHQDIRGLGHLQRASGEFFPYNIKELRHVNSILNSAIARHASRNTLGI